MNRLAAASRRQGKTDVAAKRAEATCAGILAAGGWTALGRHFRERDARSARIAGRLLRGLAAAYRRLWDRHPGLALLLLLGTVADSLIALLVTAVWAPRWAPLPAVILTAAVLLLHFAPDGDENGGGS